MLRLLVAIVLIVPTIASAEANDLLSEFAVQQGLEMEQVATDLAFPMGLVPLPDGSLLIATSPSESGNFYDSSGEILRLVDTDGDASLDKRTVVATGLPGSLVALARFDDIVITTSAAGGDESITFCAPAHCGTTRLLKLIGCTSDLSGLFIRVMRWPSAPLRKRQTLSISSSISAQLATTRLGRMCAHPARSRLALHPPPST